LICEYIPTSGLLIMPLNPTASHDRISHLINLGPTFSLGEQFPQEVRSFKEVLARYVSKLRNYIKEETAKNPDGKIMRGIHTSLLHSSGTLIPEINPAGSAVLRDDAIEITQDGYPRLRPTFKIEAVDREVLEEVMHQYLGQQYCKCFVTHIPSVLLSIINQNNFSVIATGMQRPHVPWTAIQGQDRLFVDREYVPIGFRFLSPRSLIKEEIIEFLKHIIKRQETYKSLHQVFRFRKITAGRAQKSPVVDPLYPSADENSSIAAPNKKSIAKKTPYVSRMGISVNPEVLSVTSQPPPFQSALLAVEKNGRASKNPVPDPATFPPTVSNNPAITSDNNPAINKILLPSDTVTPTWQTSADRKDSSFFPTNPIPTIRPVLPTPRDTVSPAPASPSPRNENTDSASGTQISVPAAKPAHPRPRKKQRGTNLPNEKEQTFYYQTIYGDDNLSVETLTPSIGSAHAPAPEISAPQEPAPEISAPQEPARCISAAEHNQNPPANKKARKKTADERALEEASKLSVAGKRRSIGRVRDS